MKTINQTPRTSNFINFLVLLLFGLFLGNAQIMEEEFVDTNKPETILTPDILWDVKAYLPEEKLIKIKAIDKDGKMHPVKAIQSFDDTSILDVKAIINGEYLPIKLIVKEDDVYYPLKAIDKDGTLIDIKAVTENGDILPVKGVGISGTVVHVRAIGPDSAFYNIFAISPEGKVNDVKGIKMLKINVDTIISGVLVFAHVKALRQN